MSQKNNTTTQLFCCLFNDQKTPDSQRPSRLLDHWKISGTWLASRRLHRFGINHQSATCTNLQDTWPRTSQWHDMASPRGWEPHTGGDNHPAVVKKIQAGSEGCFFCQRFTHVYLLNLISQNKKCGSSSFLSGPKMQSKWHCCSNMQDKWAKKTCMFHACLLMRTSSATTLAQPLTYRKVHQIFSKRTQQSTLEPSDSSLVPYQFLASSNPWRLLSSKQNATNFIKSQGGSHNRGLRNRARP